MTAKKQDGLDNPSCIPLASSYLTDRRKRVRINKPAIDSSGQLVGSGVTRIVLSAPYLSGVKLVTSILKSVTSMSSSPSKIPESQFPTNSEPRNPNGSSSKPSC